MSSVGGGNGITAGGAAEVAGNGGGEGWVKEGETPVGVFACGFGNRLTDTAAYNAVGVCVCVCVSVCVCVCACVTCVFVCVFI